MTPDPARAPLPPPPPDRIARLRARAERATDYYQRLAQTRPVVGLPAASFTRYAARQGFLLASAFAFRMFLWLLPLALLLTGIFAGLFGDQPERLDQAIKAAGVTGAASREVVTSLQQGHRSWWIAVLVGALLLLWTTRALMTNLRMVSAHAWQVPLPKQRFNEMLVSSVVFAFGTVALLGVVMLSSHMAGWFPGGLLVTTIVESLLTAAAWTAMSLRLPDRRNHWTDLIPGCLLVGIGLAVMHTISRTYLPDRVARSSQLYGALGVSGVILAWLLLIGHLVVGGAIVNSVWSEYRAKQRAGTTDVPGPG